MRGHILKYKKRMGDLSSSRTEMTSLKSYLLHLFYKVKVNRKLINIRVLTSTNFIIILTLNF